VAKLTIRDLDETLKRTLRVRAALQESPPPATDLAAHPFAL
jgi:plasmid stability protein